MNENTNTHRYAITLDAYDVYDDVITDVTDEYAFTLYVHDIPNFTFTNITATRESGDTITYEFDSTPDAILAYARHFDLDDELDDVFTRVD
jgi:hypothetical protein